MYKILTIAGSDCSGGAGIQADIKTITAHGMYGMSVITALTAQNTEGVYGIQNTGAEFVAAQLDCVFNDIYPDAVKIGMVPDNKTASAISEKLREYGAKNIVLDPVMSATSGGALSGDSVIRPLFPLADIITPNIPEARILSGTDIETDADMLKAAEKIASMTRGAALLKGGHLSGAANDLLYYNGRIEWLFAERIDNPNTHGTGCTLSSAIACNLAAGLSVLDAVKNAKAYITDAIAARLNIGHGSGPLNHMCRIMREQK